MHSGGRVVLVGLMLSLGACEQHDAPARSTPPSTSPPQDWSLTATSTEPPVVVDQTAISAAHTDWPYVVAQLTELRRSGDALSVNLLLRNEGVETQRPMFIFRDVHIIDAASGRTYDVLRKDDRYVASAGIGAPDRFSADLDPGQSVTMSMTFSAPPPDVKIVALHIPDISPLERLPIQDR